MTGPDGAANAEPPAEDEHARTDAARVGGWGTEPPATDAKMIFIQAGATSDKPPAVCADGTTIIDPEIRARVTASRAAKGLPPTIENLVVLERVARVFDLVPPCLCDPIEVEALRIPFLPGGEDRDGAHDGSDDRALARDVHLVALPSPEHVLIGTDEVSEH